MSAPNPDPNAGAHDGYAGEPGTYLLQGGERIAVDPAALKPLSESQSDAIQVPAPSAETNPAPVPVKKAAHAANKTE